MQIGSPSLTAGEHEERSHSQSLAPSRAAHGGARGDLAPRVQAGGPAATVYKRESTLGLSVPCTVHSSRGRRLGLVSYLLSALSRGVLGRCSLVAACSEVSYGNVWILRSHISISRSSSLCPYLLCLSSLCPYFSWIEALYTFMYLPSSFIDLVGRCTDLCFALRLRHVIHIIVLRMWKWRCNLYLSEFLVVVCDD
jgi:hypothetical protein